MTTVLLVEDDAHLREVMAYQLHSHDIPVDAVADGRLAIRFLEEQPNPALIITDVKMPNADGFKVLEAARRLAPRTPVLMLTAFGSVEMAVEAMRAGAFDFISKPFHKDQFLLTVDKALGHGRLVMENAELRGRAGSDVVAVSPSMRDVLNQARQVAATSATILLLGESGVGKEVLAHEIHRASERHDKPFIALNCAAIPRELLEAELFGFSKGAFTGAHKERVGKFVAADGGTLFLDEIGDLDDTLQAKLLRVLEQRMVDVVGGAPVAVDVRILAATHQDLAARVAEKRFRQDLFYRLAVIPLRIPPLRERPEDIAVLFTRFVHSYSGAAQVTVSEELLRAVVRRPWPGNVRELRNLAERMVALRKTDALDVSDLPPEDAPTTVHPGFLRLDPANIQLPEEGVALEDLERAVVIYALRRHAWNIAAAARYLRVPRHILIYRMEKFGITRHGT
ncbi:MAG: sigma-54-dependent Fis family transcriptional regulator [Deltaproteobacteria bacterium]|nr:sigma-54-dependent Fis family transcriptional regulator [Deltaproteobacteria bacterium]